MKKKDELEEKEEKKKTKEKKSKVKEKKKEKKVEEDKEKDIEEKIDEEKTIYVERNSGFNTFEVIVIIVISVLFGILVGYFLSSSKSKVEGTEVSHELRDFIITYNTILDTYYGEVTEKQLVNGAINGMVSSLEDPYSIYLDDNYSEDFNTTVDGYYYGVGITVYTHDGANEIISVDKHSNALNKLKEGDIIVKINNKDVKDKTGEYVAEQIKNSKEKVKITVLRDNKEKTYSIKKKKIEIDSVNSELLDNNIGYINMNNVASNTYKQFKSNLEKLEKEKIDSLIIDVRYNPGGHLKQTSQILDMFFKKNTVLYQIQTRKKTTKIKATSKSERTYPIVILTNSDSASASEIIAACFQEKYDKAYVVGEVTYGKGTVQKVVDLTSGSHVKYTTQNWLTPKGKSINGIGVKPDYVIERTEEYVKNPTRENDVQLKKAIEVLKAKKESN